MNLTVDKVKRDKDIVLSEGERAVIRAFTQSVIEGSHNRYEKRYYEIYRLPLTTETLELVKSLNNKMTI